MALESGPMQLPGQGKQSLRSSLDLGESEERSKEILKCRASGLASLARLVLFARPGWCCFDDAADDAETWRSQSWTFYCDCMTKRCHSIFQFCWAVKLIQLLLRCPFRPNPPEMRH